MFITYKDETNQEVTVVVDWIYEGTDFVVYRDLYGERCIEVEKISKIGLGKPKMVIKELQEE